MPTPNNQALAERISGVAELIEAKFAETHSRLDKLNGQVAKNTAFRNYMKPIVAILSAVSGAILVSFIG